MYLFLLPIKKVTKQFLHLLRKSYFLLLTFCFLFFSLYQSILPFLQNQFEPKRNQLLSFFSIKEKPLSSFVYSLNFTVDDWNIEFEKFVWKTCLGSRRTEFAKFFVLLKFFKQSEVVISCVRSFETPNL